MEDEGGQKVQLYIYDLTQGMAAMMSGMLLGQHFDGIWHTAVVVYGREYFYGSQGIQCCLPASTVLGQPQKIEQIGETFIPYQVFKDYVRGLAEGTYRGAKYDLLHHNCNTFSNDLCQFLCGCCIPKYILDLPHDFLATPLGQSLAPLISQIGGGGGGGQSGGFSFEPQLTGGQAAVRETSPGFDDLNTQIEAARLQSLALNERRNTIKEKLARKEKKRDKKRKKDGKSSASSGESSDVNNNSSSNNKQAEMSESTNGNANGGGGGDPIPSEMLPSEQALEDESREKQLEEERKKARDPPVVFNTVDPKVELEELVKHLDGSLSNDEQLALEELHQYLLMGEGSWALGEGFLVFVERVLRDPNVKPEVRVHLLRALSNAALKDDVILLLHQDRKDHVLMNFAQDIDRHSLEEQQAMALFMVNLFENTSPSEWLLYISEWTYNNMPTSNIRASTKLAVHCLLAKDSQLQEYGTAFIHNIAGKDVKTVVFDDVAVELAMAVLQFLNEKPSEEHLFRSMKALSRFVFVSPDIPQFVQMIGPSPSTFKGKSERIDELIAVISKKCR